MLALVAVLIIMHFLIQHPLPCVPLPRHLVLLTSQLPRRTCCSAHPSPAAAGGGWRER